MKTLAVNLINSMYRVHATENDVVDTSPTSFYILKHPITLAYTGEDRSFYMINQVNSAERYWIFHNNNLLVHREDGPAVCMGDLKEWYRFGKRHRFDGPAVISYNRQHGKYTQLWYFNGKIATIAFYDWADDMGIDINNLTETDKLMIRLRWG